MDGVTTGHVLLSSQSILGQPRSTMANPKKHVPDAEFRESKRNREHESQELSCVFAFRADPKHTDAIVRGF